MVFARHFFDCIGQRHVTGCVIRQQDEMADLHDVIRSDRWNRLFRVNIRQAGNRDRMCGMQMHDRARRRPFAVYGQMKKRFLGLLVAGKQIALRIHLGQRSRIEPAKAGIGRCHQPAAVRSHAYVAGTAHRQPAVEHRFAEQADFFSDFGFVHLSLTISIQELALTAEDSSQYPLEGYAEDAEEGARKKM